MDDLDLDLDDINEPEEAVPDTVEELLEEWEKQDIARAAKERERIAKEEEAENAALMAEASAEAAAIEQKIIELTNLKRHAQMQARIARDKLFKATEVKEASIREQKSLKERWEYEQAKRERLASMESQFVGLAWHDGVLMPDGSTAVIKDHQKEAAQYLADHQSVILGDEMGTGKTLSSIASWDYSGAKRILVFAPVDVTSNFLDEIRMWAPHRIVTNLLGLSKIDRRARLQMAKLFMESFVIVINYEAYRKDKALIDELIECQFDTINMDEAHVMKNTSSNAYDGVRQIVSAKNTCGTCGKLVDHKIINTICQNCGAHNSTAVSSLTKGIVPMTGTAILNSPEDMFSLLHLVDPTVFHTKNNFLKTYAEFDYYENKYKFASGGASVLLRRLGTKFLRRTMEDIGIILKPVQIIKHTLDLNENNYPDQYRVVTSLKEAAAIVLSATDDEGNPKVMSNFETLALMTRERQANVYPAGIVMKDPVTGEVILSVAEDVNESIKLDKARDIILEQVAAGKRLAVFSQFAGALAELERMLKDEGIRAVRFDGSTPEHIRAEVKTNFNKARGEEAKWDVVLANYKSGGVGLNFTACTHMIMLDQEWNPGKEDQTIARIRRIGQDQQTFVHILDIPGGIDRWMRGLIDAKREMIEGFNEVQADLQSKYLEQLRNPTE